MLIPRADIRRRVRYIARRITRDFRGEPVHLVGVLKGACIFLSDLVRQLDGREVRMDRNGSQVTVTVKDHTGLVRSATGGSSGVPDPLPAAPAASSPVLGRRPRRFTVVLEDHHLLNAQVFGGGAKAVQVGADDQFDFRIAE